MNASGPILLRPAVPADAEALYRLSLDAIRISAASHYTDAQLEAWCSRRTVVSHVRMIERTPVVVAELGDRLAGFASLIVGEHELDQLFVAPTTGSRGVARALLEAIDELATSAGLTFIDARASRRALSTFQAAGYHPVHEETVIIGGQRLERTHVRKPLRTD